MEQKPQRNPWFLLLATQFLALMWLGWRLLEPLGRDQAVFYVLGRELLHGRLPYRDLFEHKPPGILLIYTLAALLDGGDGWAIALLDTVSAGLTAGLLALFLQRADLHIASYFAAMLYILTARSPLFGGFWATGQPEAFQDLAVALALVLAQRERWLGAGMAIFSALLLKFTYIGLLPVFLLWAGRERALRLLAGVLAPALLLAGVGALTGTLVPAWQAAIVFNLQHAQVEATPLVKIPLKFWHVLQRLLLTIPLVLLPPLLVRWRAADREKWLLRLGLGILLAALLQLLVQRKLWLWHWLALILPLTILASLTLARLWQWRKIPTLGLTLLLGIPLVQAQIHAMQKPLTANPGADRLARYTWGGNDFSALEVALVGLTVKKHAQPGDLLLISGFEPGIYLTSGLPPGTRWLYDYPLTVGLEPSAREEAIQEILQQLPQIRLWVVMTNDANALERQDSRTQLLATPALALAQERDYRLVERVLDAEVWVRK